jgi:hypothetical protein
MTNVQLIDWRDFMGRLCGAIYATATGAPHFTAHVLLLDGGRRYAVLKLPGAELCARAPDCADPGVYVHDHESCWRVLAFVTDQVWQELEAQRAGANAPPEVANLMPTIHKWGAVRELFRPFIYEDGPWPDDTRACEIWADAEAEVFQGMVLAFPRIAQLFASDRYRDAQSPRLAKVVELARSRTGKTTKH